MTIEFKAWPKITRIENKRPPIFTEKIDGTNACVVITKEGEFGCQSRSQIITPEKDNYGFAKWAYANKEELMKLGPGHHFGEWWGLDIQRGYGLTEKRFSLFNSRRWGEHNPNTPSCVSVVPLLRFNTIDEVKQFLITNGSVAAPGYMNIEGAVMYEPDTDTCFKIIINK
jgi:RNA ligase